jgi:hypothetical protein
MSIRSKVLATAAALALIGGTGTAAVLGTGAAQASTVNCAFSNGCATLQGVDAASHAIAMDAKRQSSAAGTLIIGYPDRPGDGATNFDAVLHYTKGSNVTTYADTGLEVSDLHSVCTSVGPLSTPVVGSAVITAGNPLTVENANGTTFTSDGPATSLPFTGLVQFGTVLDENYGSGCVLAYTYTSGTPDSFVASPFITLTFPGGSVTQFNDTDTGTFSFTGLPAGISVSGGKLTADTSTAIPGTYSSVGVTFTDTGSGSQISEAFVLTVSGITSVNPGPDVPYYTFVYAKNGVWSNECVTDNNGSGALVLETCTLGHNRYQDFYAFPGNSATPSDALTSGGQFHIQDILASIVNGASSCLTDPSTSVPSVPQPDATDVVSPGGRQMYVNGSCSAAQDLFTWAS